MYVLQQHQLKRMNSNQMQFHFFQATSDFLLILVRIKRKELSQEHQPSLKASNVWQVYKLHLKDYSLQFLFRIENCRIHVGNTLLSSDGSTLLLDYKQTFKYLRYPTIDRPPYFYNHSGQVVFDLNNGGKAINMLDKMNEQDSYNFKVQLQRLNTHRHSQYVYSHTPPHTRIRHQPRQQADYQGISTDIDSKSILVDGVKLYQFDEKNLKFASIK